MPFNFSEIWKEVFKAGTHTDAGGNTREWTESDLDEIVNTYNDQKKKEKHDAPVVVGHPTDNSPAYGWVESLKRTGTTLLAKFRNVDSQFQDLVNQGRYGKISIALYPNKLLRHVGFLGAIPPAVKGLAAPKFKEKEEFNQFEIDKTVINYTEANMPENLNVFFSALLNKISNNYNPEIASQIKVDINDLAKTHKLTVSKKEEDPDGNGDHNDPTPPVSFSDSKEFKDMDAKLKKLEGDNRDMKFNEWFSEKVSSKKLTPSDKPVYRLLYSSVVERGEKAEFSDAEGKPITFAGLESLNKYIDALPKKVEFGEFASRENAADNSDFSEDDKAIEEYNKSKE